MQALLNAITTMALPTDAQRIFHGRGGLYPGCEHWSLDVFPPVFVLTSFQPASDEDLAAMGAGNVLIKGGHLESENSDDCLYLGDEQRLVTLAGERVVTRNNHGTGCTLSSAIAAYLARGEDMETAVRLGKDYITGAIQAGAAYEIGRGNGPVHHFFRFF